MNRDEHRLRVAGLSPGSFRFDGRTAVHPSEPGGGTWIALNDAGVTFALINWYSIRRLVKDGPVSRGEVVRRTRHAASPREAQSLLNKLPIERFNPFRLIGVFPQERSIYEWRWDQEKLRELTRAWKHGIWISSGFDEPGAERTRSATWERAQRQGTAGSLDWVRRLHRSHKPDCGPYSICMHRDDAVTVSYTEVVVNHRAATLRHVSGAPCENAPASEHQLALQPAFRER
ncbi:MAG: hypothetical protein HC814_00110 [Rhodobacteraceae bacterium]|nr:hypothetical protein [Paracoccaceae bacterium]